MPVRVFALTLTFALTLPAVAAEGGCVDGVCAGADHSLLQRQAIVVNEVPSPRGDASPSAFAAEGAVKTDAEALGSATSSESGRAKVRRASASNVLFPETGRARESTRRRRRSQGAPLPGDVSGEARTQKLSLIGVGASPDAGGAGASPSEQDPGLERRKKHRKRREHAEPEGAPLDTLEVGKADSARKDGAQWWFWGRRRRTGDADPGLTDTTTTAGPADAIVEAADAIVEDDDDLVSDGDGTGDAAEAEAKADLAPEIDDDVANFFDSELKKKADRAYVDAALDAKADKSWVDEEIKMVVDKYIAPLERKLGDSAGAAAIAADADAADPPASPRHGLAEARAEAEVVADEELAPEKQACHVEYSVPACGACSESRQCACVLSPGGAGNFCCPWTGKCSCGGEEELSTCQAPEGFEKKRETCGDIVTLGTNEILRAHNKYRCMHGAPPLQWSPEIAKHAQAWVDQLGGVMRHSSSKDRLNAAGFEYLGENVAKGITGAGAVDRWYSEVRNTDGGTVPGFSKKWGHYTQVVWKDTTHLGCAISSGVTVCQYGPGGNGGDYEDAVAGAVKSASECESAR